MKNFKNVKLIGYVILVLITIIGIMVIAIPAVNQSARWGSEISAAEDNNQKIADNVKSLEEKKKTHEDAVALNEELNIKFPTTASGTLLLADISNAASQSGISASAITAINIATPVLAEAEEEPAPEAADKKPAEDGETSQEAAAPATPKIATMGVEITVNGTNAQLSTFLKALRQVDRAIKIDDIQIAELDKEAPEAYSTMTIVGTTILYKTIDDPKLASAKAAADAEAKKKTTTKTE